MSLAGFTRRSGVETPEVLASLEYDRDASGRRVCQKFVEHMSVEARVGAYAWHQERPKLSGF